MGVIIFNWIIEYVVKDIPVFIAVIGAGYWFSRQTKKALQKEIKDTNTRIDEHEKSVSARFDNMSARLDSMSDRLDSMSDRLNNIQADLAEIKTEVSFERRVSKLEEKLEGQQQPST